MHQVLITVDSKARAEDLAKMVIDFSGVIAASVISSEVPAEAPSPVVIPADLPHRSEFDYAADKADAERFRVSVFVIEKAREINREPIRVRDLAEFYPEARAFVYNEDADAMGLYCWFLIDGIDVPVDPAQPYHLDMDNGCTKTVSGDTTVFVQVKDLLPRINDLARAGEAIVAQQVADEWGLVVRRADEAIKMPNQCFYFDMQAFKPYVEGEDAMRAVLTAKTFPKVDVILLYLMEGPKAANLVPVALRASGNYPDYLYVSRD